MLKQNQNKENQNKDLLLKQMNDKMNKILNYFNQFVSKLRIGKANTDLLDDITVEYYDKNINLYNISSIELTNSNTILIKPWEENMLPLIEKSILKSKLGIVPINNGKVIKLVIQKLTEERRKEIIRMNNLKLEQAKISLRNLRKEYNKRIELNLRDKDIINKYKKDINERTKQYICLIENIFNKKNKEIRTI
ncbi:ribosome-recycling factor [Candidatus Karelsulcia muelleri]